MFGCVEKSCFTALSVAGGNHACKMFTYYLSSITASAESNGQQQNKFQTDITYSLILRISPHVTYIVQGAYKLLEDFAKPYFHKY